MKRRRGRTFECNHCGAAVPAGAAACKNCGADARIGWADDDEPETPDLELEDAEYDDFLAREGLARPEGRPRAPRRGLSTKAPWFLITAAIVVGALILAALMH
ncbi:MAG: hypothetical protein JNJ88_15905 [Planctomycetes bacterium]|nr:hypothetical protein [Planctomycetota bacterium]